METGIDLVKLQIRVAQGEPLPFQQEDITSRGHAIEARIYAEDPSAGFLPSVGEIAQWIAPEGPGVRVDSGVRRGSEVSPYYDPMLAKVIAHGADRQESIARLDQALQHLVCLGVSTNVPYLLAIIRHPDFAAGRLSTRFLDTHFAHWKPAGCTPDEALLALAADAVTRPAAQAAGLAAEDDPYSPWRAGGGWRNA